MKKIELKNIIKESIADYLSELNTTNHLEEELIDETPITEEKTTFEDKVTKDGNIYLVKKATKDMSEGGIVETVTLQELLDGNMIGGTEYKGAYLNSNQALAAGKKALKQRDAELKENVKKGQAKVGDLETQIATLKVDMQKLIDNPDTRSELGSYTARLEKFEALLGKLKSALDSNSPKKEKKEDESKDELNESLKIVWDKSKLTRTSYNNGKYNTSEKFKSVEELLANKEKADEVQKRREEKGRDKIDHILK